MIEIEKPRIDTVELTSDGKYGKFVMSLLREAMPQLSATV